MVLIDEESVGMQKSEVMQANFKGRVQDLRFHEG